MAGYRMPPEGAIKIAVDENGVVLRLYNADRYPVILGEFEGAARCYYRSGTSALAAGDNVIWDALQIQVSIGTHNNPTTYRITLDGVDYDFAATTETEAQILDGLAAAIDADLFDVVDNTTSLTIRRNEDGAGYSETRQASHMPFTAALAIVSGTGTFDALVTDIYGGDAYIRNGYGQKEIEAGWGTSNARHTHMVFATETGFTGTLYLETVGSRRAAPQHRG